MVTTSKNITMSLLESINQLNPYAVGFERQLNRLNSNEYTQQKSTGYPPYNIRKTDDFTHVIEMAIAGFGKDDVEVEIADGILTIRSVKETEANSEVTDGLLHHGISYRKFNRKFTLADDVVVNDAKLENGLLKIILEQIVPEEKKPRLITIK